MHYQMVPDSVIALQEELKNHQDLSRILVNSGSFEEQLAEIAAYCNVVVDDYVDVGPFCDLLVQRLKQKGSLVIRLN